MKYRIGNQVINSDQIVRVKYWPESGKTHSSVDITLTAQEPVTDYNGNLSGCSQSVTLELSDPEQADAFWQVYSGDAYTVVA